MKIIKITAGFLFLALAFLPLFSFAFSDLRVVNYKLNGKEESARFNPSTPGISGGKVVIEINAIVPTKFNTIAICATTDSVCNRTTAVKYFTKTDTFVSSVSKEWDGRTSKGEVVMKDNYKIKVTMKDETGAEKIQELAPYIITVDSIVLNVSNSSESKSSSALASLSSQSQSASLSSSVASQSNLDNDPVVKKIRDFIANGGRESEGVATPANKNEIKKISGSQSAKAPSDNGEKSNAKEVKVIKPKNEEAVSSSAIQAAEVALSEDSNHSSFIWKILNLPFDGFNLVKRLFYSGS